MVSILGVVFSMAALSVPTSLYPPQFVGASRHAWLLVDSRADLVSETKVRFLCFVVGLVTAHRSR